MRTLMLITITVWLYSLVACEAFTSARKFPLEQRVGDAVRGEASWYSTRTNGTTTASGIPLNDSKLTAAHKTLPFGTRVRVTNLDKDTQVIVKITDRGPFIPGRIIDVSHAAAKELDMIHSGVCPCQIEVLKSE